MDTVPLWSDALRAVWNVSLSPAMESLLCKRAWFRRCDALDRSQTTVPEQLEAVWYQGRSRSQMGVARQPLGALSMSYIHFGSDKGTRGPKKMAARGGGLELIGFGKARGCSNSGPLLVQVVQVEEHVAEVSAAGAQEQWQVRQIQAARLLMPEQVVHKLPRSGWGHGRAIQVRQSDGAMR